MPKNRNKPSAKNQALNVLRNEAEKVLMNRDEAESPSLSETDIKKLFQELQVHQLELEMQNDELRKANEEPEIQRIELAGIYDLAPVGYFIVDKLGIIEEVNTEGLHLLNTPKSLLLKRRFQSFVAREDLDRFYNFQQNMLSIQKPQSCQLKLVSGGKDYFYVQLEGIAIHIHGDVQCYIAVINITERIEAEHNLATIKERLELASEASAAGTWEIDLKTEYFFLDESNHVICGLEPDAFDGNYKSFLGLIHPDDRQRVGDHFRNAMNKELEINTEFCVQKPAGKTCYIALRGHIIGKPDNKRLVGTMMDITEKKLLEKETGELRLHQQRNITAAILQAQENERKRISESLHDSVSQLLYGIKLNLQQLDTQQLLEINLENVKKLLDEAIKEARNISFELAPSILTDFGLSATIKEMAKRLSTRKMSIKVSIDIGRLELPLEVNIFRIVQELLNNCIKHSEATVVNLGMKRTNNFIRIRVKDNGKGFDTNDREKLSAGSGLSSIRNRLTLYDGTMQVQSLPGKGTVVYITLKNI